MSPQARSTTWSGIPRKSTCASTMRLRACVTNRPSGSSFADRSLNPVGIGIRISTSCETTVGRSSGRRRPRSSASLTVSLMISLRSIDDANREAVEALDVSPEQQRFVSNAADSIREAAGDRMGAHCYWAIYADETPVGFVMISDDVGGPGYFPQYLWKLFIDERHQGRGYGTATLDLIADYFRRRPEVEIMRTSCGQGKGSPLGSTSATASSRPVRSSSTTRFCCSTGFANARRGPVRNGQYGPPVGELTTSFDPSSASGVTQCSRPTIRTAASTLRRSGSCSRTTAFTSRRRPEAGR